VASRNRAELTIAAVAVGFGTIGPLARWTGLPPATIAGGRCVIAAVALWALGLVRSEPPGPAAPRWGVVSSGGLLAVHWWAMFAALDRAPVGLVLLVVYVAPVLVAIGSPIIGEVVSLRTGIATVAGLVGVALVVGHEVGRGSAAGVGLALVSAATFAAVALVDRRLAVRIGGVRLARAKLTVAGVVLMPFALWSIPGSSGGDRWWLVVIGLVHTAVGLTLVLGALTRVPATVAAVLLYLEPPSAVLFGWWWLGERLAPATLLGGAIIIGAGVLASSGTQAAVGRPTGTSTRKKQR
jgi:drug/metabolite transporter (DMT)-like permease